MNELLIANNPERWDDAGREFRMCDARIEDGAIRIEIINVTGTDVFIYRDVVEFMEDWRLARGVEDFKPWEPHSMDEIMINHNNVFSGNREKAQKTMQERTNNVVPFPAKENKSN